MITPTATATHAIAPAPRITAARRRSGWRNQSQTASPATSRPTCSWVSTLGRRRRPGRSRRSSAAQMQQIISGAASVTGWKSKRVACWSAGNRRTAAPRRRGGRRRASAAPARTPAAPRARRSPPGPPAASRGSTTPTTGGEEHEHQVDVGPEAVNWTPETSVVSRKRPSAVFQSAWTMFPRSKRPVEKPRGGPPRARRRPPRRAPSSRGRRAGPGRAPAPPPPGRRGGARGRRPRGQAGRRRRPVPSLRGSTSVIGRAGHAPRTTAGSARAWRRRR